jgi:hypothetical protein
MIAYDEAGENEERPECLDHNGVLIYDDLDEEPHARPTNEVPGRTPSSCKTTATRSPLPQHLATERREAVKAGD